MYFESSFESTEIVSAASLGWVGFSGIPTLLYDIRHGHVGPRVSVDEDSRYSKYAIMARGDKVDTYLSLSSK